MKPFWIPLCALLAAPVAIAQYKDPVGNFTRSPTEHIINRVETPFVVRSLKGSIRGHESLHEPVPNVLFEIRGPGEDQTIKRATTDKQGRFRIRNLAPGSYEFKATLNGYQSVMGEITISPTASKKAEITLELPLGV